MLKNDVMMTSLMINLDSEAQFFTEIEEYTGDTVIFLCKLEKDSIQTFFISAIFGYWRSSWFDTWNVIFNNCLNSGLVYFNACTIYPSSNSEMSQ